MERSTLFRIGVVALQVLLGAIALGCAASGHPSVVVAALVCLVCTIPILMTHRLDLFSPWNYMFYFVGLNVLLRTVFIDFDISGEYTDIDGIFFLGKSREFMVESTAVLLLGFVFLTIGYLWAPNRPMPLRYRVFQTNSYEPRRYKRVVTLMLLASGLAFLLFFRLTFKGIGELAIGMLSQHRGLSEDITEYKAYGYLRLLIGLSSLVVYLAYVRLRTSNRNRGYYRLMLTLGILVSVAMAFYSQGRAALVFVFLNLIFIKYYLEDHRFPWKVFALLVPFIVALFVLVSSFRGGSGVSLQSDVTAMTVVAPIVLNNGGIDASKTGHVIDYTTDTQDYKFGQTLVQFIWATVPRQIWLHKPVNLDTYVGEKIYGAETFGASAVPPGFFAEMYMNFWYAGIIVGALALGALMKRIQNALDSNKGNINFVVFYVVVLQSFGMSVLGSGFSSTVMGMLMAGVPLMAALSYATSRRRVAAPEGFQGGPEGHPVPSVHA